MMRARMRDHPLDVPAPGRHRPRGGGNDPRHRQTGAALEPTMNLSMAVGKAKTARADMINGGHVPPGIRVGDAGDQPAVVDAVRMLVHKDKKVRWRGPDDVRHPVVTVI